MVDKKKAFGILVIAIFFTVILLTSFNQYSKKESFSVNTFLLKLNIPLEGESVSNIKIVNNEKTNQNFKIYFNDLKDLVFVEENEFTLESGESKEIKVHIKDTKKEVNTYFGYLIIETSLSTKKIPIVFNVEDKNRTFAIIQSNIPKYDEVYPGGKLGIEIKLFNLKDENLYNVQTKYSVRNFDGEVISSEDEDLVIKGDLGLTKIIDIPKTLPYGDYIFITSIEYQQTKTTAGYLFNVLEKKETFSGSLRFFITLVFIFIMGVFALFFYFMKTRDDLLIQLKKQQNIELKRNSELIKSFERRIKTKKTLQRKKKINELKKVRKKIIRNIKIKQKKQRQELKMLKKSGKENETKKKVSAWEKEGYKMFETEKEIDKISKQGIKKHVTEWKKGGYDTSVLDK